nr:MAG TPA: hypothetical protein [Bacteriophage sp.]
MKIHLVIYGNTQMMLLVNLNKRIAPGINL